MGTGSGQPTGFVTALVGTGSVVPSAGADVLAPGDVFSLQDSLPPRFQPNSQWAAALSTYNSLRQMETTNGSLKFPSLQENPPTLLGRAANEVSNVDATINAGQDNYILAIGDWSQFVIVDRIPTVIEMVPHMFRTANNRPSGQRGALLWARTGSDILVDNAFRVLNVT